MGAARIKLRYKISENGVIYFEHYDRRKGLTWKWTKGHMSHENGYSRCTATIHGRRRRVHQWVWEAFNGPVPKGMCIDHINRDATDNRLSNLRLATKSQNAMNAIHPKRELPKGVYKHRKKYQAKIKANGITYVSGGWDTPELGHKAYLELGYLHHGEFFSSNEGIENV